MFSTNKTFINTRNSTEAISVTIGRNVIVNSTKNTEKVVKKVVFCNYQSLPKNFPEIKTVHTHFKRR